MLSTSTGPRMFERFNEKAIKAVMMAQEEKWHSLQQKWRWYLRYFMICPIKFLCMWRCLTIAMILNHPFCLQDQHILVCLPVLSDRHPGALEGLGMSQHFFDSRSPDDWVTTTLELRCCWSEWWRTQVDHQEKSWRSSTWRSRMGIWFANRKSHQFLLAEACKRRILYRHYYPHRFYQISRESYMEVS